MGRHGLHQNNDAACAQAWEEPSMILHASTRPENVCATAHAAAKRRFAR
jgi:hypothetical protein